MELSNFACTECSYAYRPAFGEDELGIPPGTPFSSLPEDFRCPGCGAAEDAFFGIPFEILEATDPDDPSDAERSHIPYYRFLPE